MSRRVIDLSIYLENDDASLIWEGHKAGRDIGYCAVGIVDERMVAAFSA